MTSVKIKFRKSTIKNKEGVLYIQIIHSRETKLITTRFRLHSFEWDNRSSTVITNTIDSKRISYLQNIKDGLESEIRQINDLISILEKRGDYSTK